MIIFFLFLGQCVFAFVAIIVLKKFLDKELLLAALEEFESCKFAPETKEVTVRFASSLNDQFKDHLELIRKRKIPQARLDFQEDAGLKGGVVIVAGELFLDFSLSDRLRHFWSHE